MLCCIHKTAQVLVQHVSVKLYNEIRVQHSLSDKDAGKTRAYSYDNSDIGICHGRHATLRMEDIQTSRQAVFAEQSCLTKEYCPICTTAY